MSGLELIDLARRYGDRVALDGVSFTVEPGQTLGFVGPNGAGKPTTMRIVLGVLSADSGEVRCKGAPVDAATRTRFGYMPEERGPYPKMRVRAQLVYLAALHGVADARGAADRWLERLGIAERAEDRVEQLLLGNQQRVQLAAALVHEPDLLVLDEPFSGLGPVGVDVLSGVLKEDAATGVPVVFSLSSVGPAVDSKRVVADRDELASVLLDSFGIALGGSRLERVWEQAVAQHEAFLARA